MADAAANLTYAPPNVLIQADNTGPLVNVLNWILVVFAAVFVVARVVVKFLVTKPQLDDALIGISLLASVGHCVAVSLQVTNGLGQPIAKLSPDQIEGFQKAGYASTFLYIVAICANEISTLAFLHLITVLRGFDLMRKGTMAAVVAWGVCSVFATAFQCSLPNPWQSLGGTMCYNRTAFRIAYDVINIVFEVLVIILPLIIIFPIRMDSSQKAKTLFCFSARLLNIGAIIAQIYFTKIASLEDPTFGTYPAVIASLFVVNISIASSCLPYIKPLLISISSGMIRVDDLRRRQASLPGIYSFVPRPVRSLESQLPTSRLASDGGSSGTPMSQSSLTSPKLRSLRDNIALRISKTRTRSLPFIKPPPPQQQVWQERPSEESGTPIIQSAPDQNHE